MSAPAVPTAYDAVPYRSLPIPEAHVDRLFMLGQLFGTSPVDPAQARVLEIGCSDGGHLVPQAVTYPRSQFVGIDLAATQIAAGRRWVAPLGLDNLRLEAGDATEVAQALGPFDYVLCHGVYSWVPAAVQPALLRTIAQVLAPGGIATVSFNVLPGFAVRQSIRTFLREHMAPTDDAADRVASARALIGFLHEATPTADPRGRALQQACAELLGASPQYLVHGLLGEHNRPCTLVDFVRAAADQGLAYLGDAELGTMTGEGLPTASLEALASVPGDQLQRESVLDVLAQRTFRRSLLVPRSTPITRRVSWRRCLGWWVSARRVPPDVTDPTERAAFVQLVDAWPGQLPVMDWLQATARAVDQPVDVVAASLGPTLLPAWARGTLFLHPRDLGIATAVPDHPRAAEWARRQQSLGQPVTDLRHQHRVLPDRLGELLTRCTGEADRTELAPSDGGALRGLVDRALLARG